MIKDEYSGFKIIHHRDKLNELATGHQTVPIELHIVPTNRCNHSCNFCAYRMKDAVSTEKFDGREELSSAKLIEILESARSMGVKAINFSGGGEPLLHPNIVGVIKYAADKFDTSLITNGSLLTEDLCKLLADASWCRVSLDANSAGTYTKIRNVPEEHFFKVLRGIENLVKYKKSLVVGVGFVATGENYNEILQFTRSMKNIGVDNVRLSIAYTPEGSSSFNDWITEATTYAEYAELLQDDDFTVFNTIKDKVADVREGTQDYDRCYVKDLQAYIGADSNVYMCCTYAYNNKGLIGSLDHHTFKQLWESKYKENFYNTHSPRRDCKIPCQYKGRNEFISYCLKENPRHANFI